MHRRLLRLRESVPAGDTAWSLAMEATTIVVLTISFPLLGRNLGPAGYGSFVALMGIIGVASAFNNSGLSLTVYEHVVGEGEDPRAVTRSCLGISMVMGVLASLAVVAIGALTVRDLPLGTIALFAVGELMVNALVALLTAVVMAVRSFAAATRIRIAAIIARAILLVVLAVLDSLTLDVYAVAMVGLYVAAALLLMPYVQRMLGDSFWPVRADRRHVRTASLYAVSITAAGIRDGGDKPVLTAAGHDVDAGLYGAAYRIFQVAGSPIRALGAATHLSFLEPKEGEGAQLRLARNLSILAALYAMIAAVGVWLVAPALPVLLGDEFAEASTIVRWLAPVLVVSSTSVYPANALLGLGQNGLRTKIIVATSSVGLGLYIALIPTYSWRGAVVATVIVELLAMLVAWWALMVCQRAHDEGLRRAAAAASDLAVDAAGKA